MYCKVIGFVLFLFFVIQVKSDDTGKSNDSTNEVKQPQLGSLQKFVSLGLAYNIPDGMSPVEFYEQQRNETAEEEEIVEIKSDNYPKPYKGNGLKEFSISVENSTGIEVIIHDLDIDPHTDFLKLSPVKPDGTTENGMLFTGALVEPLKLRLLRGKEIKLEFGAWTKPNHNHRGFRLTYTPYRNISTTRQPPPEKIVPMDKLPSLHVLLLVSNPNQTTETWEHFREFLCNATNKFLTDSKLLLEECHPENVTIKAVVKCPDQWPNSDQCIDLSFAISLYAVEDEASYNPIFRESRDPSGLTQAQLDKVWDHFGRSLFSSSGFPEYKLPDTSRTITLWIGVVLGIVGLAFVILVVMMRLSAIRDYWPTLDDDKQNILKNSPEMDISMFPSPEQVVPPLFPVGAHSFSGENATNFKTSNGSNDQENEALRRKSSTGFSAYNQAFVEDEEHITKRPNYQTYVEGVSTDEAMT